MSSHEGQTGLQLSAAQQLILAIDPDHHVIDLYRRYLEGSGWSVISLNHLDQVVEAARGLQPGAITLDLAMKEPEASSGTGEQVINNYKEADPPLDGLKVLERLKKDPTTRHIPVIICSMLSLQDRAFELGAAEYLLKPILEEDLVNAIKGVQAKENW
jgi:CheY-like chemotaxis protein